MIDKFIMLPWSFIRDKETTMMEKMILSEIMNLSSLEHGCIASNTHFAELSGTSTKNVSRTIGSLVTKGYVETFIEPGSRNHSRKITVIKMIPSYPQIEDKVPSKRGETKGNILINNNIGDVERVIKYLNTKAGTNYKASSKANQKWILSRVKDGHTLEEFAHVIDVKVKEWTGTKQEKFLRPETLFGNKFDGYLQQKKVQTNKQTADGVEYTW